MQEGRLPAAFFFCPPKSMKRLLVRMFPFLAAVCIAVGVGVTATGASSGNPPLRYTFLALERGEATLVQAPGGTNALIGAGAPGEADAIVAALKRRGVATVDPLVLFTWDERTIGGALELIRRLKAHQVIHNPIYQETPLSRKFYLAAHELDAQHKIVLASPTPGQAFTAFYNPPCQMTFVGPTGPMLVKYRKTGCSVTMGYDYDRFTALFLGDLNRSQQQVLWSQLDFKPRGELLVLGRNGDSEALLPALLKPLKTRIAVIPVPKKGPRPAAATLDALRKAGVRVYRTDLDGAITVTTTGSGMTVKTHSS